MRSAPLPAAKMSRLLTAEETRRLHEQFEELDARQRLYVSEEEVGLLIASGAVCHFGFGGNRVWLLPNPQDRSAFDALIKIRTTSALVESGAIKAEGR